MGEVFSKKAFLAIAMTVIAVVIANVVWAKVGPKLVGTNKTGLPVE